MRCRCDSVQACAGLAQPGGSESGRRPFTNVGKPSIDGRSGRLEISAAAAAALSSQPPAHLAGRRSGRDSDARPAVRPAARSRRSARKLPAAPRLYESGIPARGRRDRGRGCECPGGVLAAVAGSARRCAPRREDSEPSRQLRGPVARTHRTGPRAARCVRPEPADRRGAPRRRAKGARFERPSRRTYGGSDLQPSQSCTVSLAPFLAPGHLLQTHLPYKCICRRGAGGRPRGPPTAAGYRCSLKRLDISESRTETATRTPAPGSGSAWVGGEGEGIPPQCTRIG